MINSDFEDATSEACQTYDFHNLEDCHDIMIIPYDIIPLINVYRVMSSADFYNLISFDLPRDNKNYEVGAPPLFNPPPPHPLSLFYSPSSLTCYVSKSSRS